MYLEDGEGRVFTGVCLSTWGTGGTPVTGSSSFLRWRVEGEKGRGYPIQDRIEVSPFSHLIGNHSYLPPSPPGRTGVL